MNALSGFSAGGPTGTFGTHVDTNTAAKGANGGVDHVMKSKAGVNSSRTAGLTKKKKKSSTNTNNSKDLGGLDEDDTMDEDSETSNSGLGGNFSHGMMKGTNAASKKPTKRKRVVGRNGDIVISNERKSTWSELLARRPQSKDPRNLSSWLNEVLQVSDLDVSLEEIAAAATKSSKPNIVGDDASSNEAMENNDKDDLEEGEVEAKKIKVEKADNLSVSKSSSKSLKEDRKDDSAADSTLAAEAPKEKKDVEAEKSKDEDKKDEDGASLSAVTDAPNDLKDTKDEKDVEASSTKVLPKDMKDTHTKDAKDAEGSSVKDEPNDKKDTDTKDSNDAKDVEAKADSSEEKSGSKRPEASSIEKDDGDEGFASSSFADWKKAKKSLKKGSSLRK